jgi:hypothetical protein
VCRPLSDRNCATYLHTWRHYVGPGRFAAIMDGRATVMFRLA